MKKFISLLVCVLFVSLNLSAQWTPDETIPVWQKRYVPSARDVDSTFSSIVFKTEKDSFVYADIMNFENRSVVYSTLDSLELVVQPIQDDSSITYIGLTITSDNVVGYPAYGATDNVVVIDPASNSNFVTTDTFTVTVEFDVYTPSGAVDTIRVTTYCGSLTPGGAESSTTKFPLGNANNWVHKTCTLEVTAPTDNTVQPVLVVLAPKFTAVNHVCNIANVKVKIAN